MIINANFAHIEYLFMILVTGGTGFLGAHLLTELCTSKDLNIRALKRSSADQAYTRTVFSFYHKDHLFDRIDWVEGDILDIHCLSKAMQGVEQVYHCAATVSFSHKNSKTLTVNNVKGTANVVNTAIDAGVKKLCHVSSIAIAEDEELLGDTIVWDRQEKHSAYATSKYKAELEIWRGAAEGLDTVIVRPSVITGPSKPDSGLGVLFNKIRKGFKYYPAGSSAYVDVRDVARAMISLMDSDIKNETYVVSAENLTYREFFALIAETVGKPAPGRRAGSFLTGLAWRCTAVNDFITGKDSDFNKTIAEISQKTSVYSNKKLTEALSFSYIQIKKSLSDTYNFFKFLSGENHERRT
ncbi:MAG TPA: NAD-dependent epimerase/dehydratase family protein [Bacteroidales bacterium]|nr:NAD-dependent epimerase/dehydratase family protein [Bacteroidales bacterium]